MKKNRSAVFLSFLLSLILLAVLCVPLCAAAEEETESVTLPPDPAIQSRAALLVDLNNHGKMLYGLNEHDAMYPASLTKIMTALLVLEAIDEGRLSLDAEIVASSIVNTLPAGSSTATPAIKEGEILTVRNLLYCLLVKSANESADILAEAVSGSVSEFVSEMNQKAEELGCENTHFVNPHGFHDPSHYTTAWDVAVMTRAAMKYPDFMGFCDTVNVQIPATNLSKARDFWNTNALRSRWNYGQKYINPEAHGVKTGSTNEAGYCLVSTGERGRVRLLSVVMGAEIYKESDGSSTIRSFSETNRLLKWGLDNFHYATIMDAETPLQEVPVDLSRTDHVVAVSSGAVEALVPGNLSAEHMERVLKLNDEILTAPVETGQDLGRVELRYNGVSYGETGLLALSGAEASRFLVIRRQVEDFLKKPVVWAAGGVIGALALALIVRGMIAGRGRNRYGGSTGRSGYTGRKRR